MSLFLLVDCAYISIRECDGEFSLHLPPVKGSSIETLREQLIEQGWSCDGPFEIVGPRRVPP